MPTCPIFADPVTYSLQTFCFKIVLFGATCSPIMLRAMLRCHLQNIKLTCQTHHETSKLLYTLALGLPSAINCNIRQKQTILLTAILQSVSLSYYGTLTQTPYILLSKQQFLITIPGKGMYSEMNHYSNFSKNSGSP